MKHISVVNETIPDQVKMVRFRLNNGWDYCWITYHEVKGFISIASSYGNYSYIWSAMGKDTLLPEFFTRADKYYLANKFFSDSRREKMVFDLDKGFSDLKKELFTSLRSGDLSSETARLIYDELVECQEDMDSGGSNEAFMNALYDLPNFIEWNQDPYESNPGSKHCGSYLILQDELVPLIQDYFNSLKSEKQKSLAA